MRKELEIIEKIEKYLMDNMSTSNRDSFESKLNTDPELQANVSFQKDLVEGLQRMGLKGDASKAYKSYLFRKWMILGSVVIGFVSLLSILIFNYSFEKSEVEINDNTNTAIIQAPLIEGITDVFERNQIPFESRKDLHLRNQDLNTSFIEMDETYDSSIQIRSNTRINGISTDQSDVIISDNADFSISNSEELNKTNLLTPLDINIADFYPSGFSNKLNELGVFDNIIKDKLYYSFNTCSYLSAHFENYETLSLKKNRFILSDRILFKRRRLNLNNIILDSPKNEKYFNSYKKKNRKFSTYKSNFNGSDETEHVLVQDSITGAYSYPPLQIASSSTKNSYLGTKAALKTIEWQVYVEQIDGDIFDIVFQVKQLDGSYIYSIDEKSEYNMPTLFSFGISDGMELIGSVQEYGMESYNKEPHYAIDAITKYGDSSEVKFVQRVKMNRMHANMEVHYAYMLCAYGVKTLAPVERVATIQLDLMEDNVNCGIKPATIQTIKNDGYNNSNLATKEFEERMPWIHRSCNNEILELYIIHLDKNLSSVDSMVVQLLPKGEIRKKFEQFAARGDGEIGENLPAKIEHYYASLQKRRTLSEGIMSLDTNYLDLKKTIVPTLFACNYIDAENVLGDENNEGNNKMEIMAASQFSPNRDGVNDYYFFKLAEDYKEFEVVFKDVQGSIVFRTKDQNFKWYGKDLEGKKLPKGMYKGTVYAVDKEGYTFEVLLEVKLVR